jgi:methionyl aminopeptidase
MVKTPLELALMREAGKRLAAVFDMLDGLDLCGLSTLDVNDRVEDYIVRELDCRPASKGQYGYAYVLNASRNHVVCHGVPDASEKILDGDIVNFDITLERHGFIADSSKTYLVGAVDPAARRLVRTTQDALWKGIAAVRDGAHVGDIGHAIERHARANGYSVVRQFCGHGIGRQMHEAPDIPAYGRPGTGPRLQEGMVFTIEPMVNVGGRRVKTLADGWTVITSDRTLSAQFEHTVAVTATGAEVLTLQPRGQALPRNVA